MVCPLLKNIKQVKDIDAREIHGGAEVDIYFQTKPNMYKHECRLLQGIGNLCITVKNIKLWINLYNNISGLL